MTIKYAVATGPVATVFIPAQVYLPPCTRFALGKYIFSDVSGRIIPLRLQRYDDRGGFPIALHDNSACPFSRMVTFLGKIVIYGASVETKGKYHNSIVSNNNIKLASTKSSGSIFVTRMCMGR